MRQKQRELNEKAILKTIIYSDIFDYPLTQKELRYYLLSTVYLPKTVAVRSKYIERLGEYLFIRGRKKLIQMRKKREQFSEKKIFNSEKIIALLGKIPSICTIGISGSLAMKNATVSDDIDLFIITKENSIWITRLLVTLILLFLNKKRNRRMRNASGRFCTNMFITDNALTITSKKQNLYTAHEVVQMKPMFDVDHTYKKFLISNAWVKQFLPHAIPNEYPSVSGSIIRKVLAYMLTLFDFPTKMVQVIYMYRHKTREVTHDTLLAFHPKDLTQKILKAYAQKLKQYEISI